MKYIFNGDIGNIGLQITSDPDEVERIICHVWSKAEFHQMTGILIPDNVELLSLEPDRNITVIKLEDEVEAEGFENIADSPQYMQDLWVKRQVIRKHLKAAVMEKRDIGYFYEYDEGQDKTTKTEDPNREHNLATTELTTTKIGCRIVIDLVDILLAKNIITLEELPDYYNTKVYHFKSIVNRIKWDLM
jgi:hypothetical protein